MLCFVLVVVFVVIVLFDLFLNYGYFDVSWINLCLMVGVVVIVFYVVMWCMFGMIFVGMGVFIVLCFWG